MRSAFSRKAKHRKYHKPVLRDQFTQQTTNVVELITIVIQSSEHRYTRNTREGSDDKLELEDFLTFLNNDQM